MIFKGNLEKMVSLVKEEVKSNFKKGDYVKLNIEVNNKFPVYNIVEVFKMLSGSFVDNGVVPVKIEKVKINNNKEDHNFIIEVEKVDEEFYKEIVKVVKDKDISDENGVFRDDRIISDNEEFKEVSFDIIINEEITLPYYNFNSLSSNNMLRRRLKDSIFSEDFFNNKIFNIVEMKDINIVNQSDIQDKKKPLYSRTAIVDIEHKDVEGKKDETIKKLKEYSDKIEEDEFYEALKYYKEYKAYENKENYNKFKWKLRDMYKGEGLKSVDKRLNILYRIKAIKFNDKNKIDKDFI